MAVMYSQCPLAERYVFDILTLTYEKKRIKASDLQTVASSYRTAKKQADMLVELGLLEMRIEDEDRLRKIYTLTPKGRKVASHLCNAKAELSETYIPPTDAPRE